MSEIRDSFNGLCNEDRRDVLKGIESILDGVTNHLKMKFDNSIIQSEALKVISETIELQKAKEAIRRARRTLTQDPNASLNELWDELDDYFNTSASTKISQEI